MRASTSHRGKFEDVAIIFGRLDLCPLSVDGVLGHGCVQDPAPMTTENGLRAVLLTMMKKEDEKNFGGYSTNFIVYNSDDVVLGGRKDNDAPCCGHNYE